MALTGMLSGVFGTRHDRERKRVQPIVDEINEHYARLQTVSEEELRSQTERHCSRPWRLLPHLRSIVGTVQPDSHALQRSGVRPGDVAVLMASAVTVSVVTLAATLVPALRAAAFEPARALRQD